MERCIWCRIFGPEPDCSNCFPNEFLDWEAHKLLQELKESDDE